ncbi:MAG: LytTR family transcriptional regulator DNA-binding domain-containing protein [Balneolales bacterium]|nr:LytTR family transcriptional regulator DNA-binding domain-containing protein [Balneolales bacterium]
MQTGKHLLFWILISLFLIAGFGSTFSDFAKTFYFVSFLMPVAVGTSYFFNYYLVPVYLLQKSFLRFWLYTAYTIIISFFLQLIVMLLAFVVIAEYNYQVLDPVMANVFVLASVIYLVVFLKAFLLLYLRFVNKESELSARNKENEGLKTAFITIREKRENRQIRLSGIISLESLGDYVKITTNTERFTTKETLAAFEQQLPDYFIRTHRSFIVNRNHVQTFSATSVTVPNSEIPVSRTYKKQVMAVLTG